MYEPARDMPGQASGGYLRGGVPFSNVNLSRRRSLFPFRNVLGFAQYDWQCISVSCCWNLKRWSIRELQKRWGEGVTRTKERKKAVWMSRGQRRSKRMSRRSFTCLYWPKSEGQATEASRVEIAMLFLSVYVTCHAHCQRLPREGPKCK